MNIVAYPLQEAERNLQAINAKYKVVLSQHRKKLPTTSEKSDICFYVIRQQVDAEGIYHLVVAAKMGKGVF